MGVGAGEAIIIGLVCCLVGGGGALVVGLVLLTIRKSKKRNP